MNDLKEPRTRKRSAVPILIVLLVVAVAAVIVLLLLIFRPKQAEEAAPVEPAIAVETPQKPSASSGEPFTVDVSLTDLGEENYPAASFSFSFDARHLEFLGVEDGTVPVYGDGASALPEWDVDVERSNQLGQINVMYLDITGGRYAFSKSLLPADETPIVLRLSFRPREGASPGDAYEIHVNDAVFAASDGALSLGTQQGTLKAEDGWIVLGE